MTENKYYNLDKLLSYNKNFNFVLGGRSLGKTTSTMTHLIKRFYKKGEMFFLIRRSELELRSIARGLFNTPCKLLGKEVTFCKEFEEYFFYIKDAKDTSKMSKKEYEEYRKDKGKVFGYASSIEKAGKNKSGRPYDSVKYIVFDEFLPNSNKIKPNEPFLLVELFITISRAMGVMFRDNVQVLMLSNNTMLFNEYFTYFKVDYNKLMLNQKRFYIEEGLAIEFCDINTSLQDEMQKSEVGRLLDKIGYLDYAVKNESVDKLSNNNCLILNVEHLKPELTINIKNTNLSLYIVNGLYYFCEKQNNVANYTINQKDDSKDLIPVKIRNFISSLIYYKKLYYENFIVKHIINYEFYY